MLAVLLSVVFVLVCILLIFMVVITPAPGEGLASAFGGMGSDTFFGTKASQHINRFMIVLAAAFVLLAIAINKTGGKKEEGLLREGPASTEPAPPTNP